MNTESRTKDLYVMHNNIISECEKMRQYLQNIKQKSEDAISFLVHLSNSNLLKNYSSTYEFLNKFYLKLLDQNCGFELFFLELDTPAVMLNKEMLYANSTNISLKDTIACSQCSLDNVTLTTLPRKTNESFERNLFQTCFERSRSRCSNVINQELQIIELCDASASQNIENYVDNQVVHCSSPNLQEDIPEVVSEILESSNASEINICQHNISVKPELQFANNCDKVVANLCENNAIEDSNIELNEQLNFNMNSEESSPDVQLKASDQKSETGNMSAIDSISISSEQVTEPESIKREYSVQNTERDINRINDLKIALRNVEQRHKEKKSKRSMVVPDLRPVVKKNNNPSLEMTAIPVEDVSNNAENIKSVRRKEVCNRNELDDGSAIVLKRGPVPKIGDICYVSYAESPSSFYVQVIREENTLIDYLSDQIVEIANSLRTYRSKLDAYKAIDKYCVCYIEEYSAWYRAVIVEWLLDDDENVLVRLIDHGCTSLVPLKFVREGVSYFFVLPVMAEKCDLAWIKPPNNLNEWPEESFDYFYNIINPQANRLFTINFVEQMGETLTIDLETNDMESIVQFMLDAKKADIDVPGATETGLDRFMKKQILKSQDLDECNNISEEERLEKAFKLDDEEVDDPNIAVSHYRARDEAEVCRIFLQHGKCFKGNHCRFSHKPLNPDGWTTDKEAVFYISFNQLQLPCPGTNITVKIIHIVDVRTFYVVIKLLSNSTNFLHLPINTIKALVKSMNSPEEVRAYQTTTVIPALSQMILVKHTNDLWQRGRVVDINEYANRVELGVFLVDFGSVIRVNMRDTRCIKEHHLQLPFQAVMCTLANVILKPNMTEQEHDMGCDFLEMNILLRKLEAKVISRSDSYLNILLYNEDGQDLGRELIKSEIVRECEQFFTPRDFLVD